MLDPVVHSMEHKKRLAWSRDFPPASDQGTEFFPLILTAGGGTGKTFDELMRTCLARIPHYPDKIQFRKYVRSRLSITLLRFSSYMALKAKYLGEPHASAQGELTSLELDFD